MIFIKISNLLHFVTFTSCGTFFSSGLEKRQQRLPGEKKRSFTVLCGPQVQLCHPATHREASLKRRSRLEGALWCFLLCVSQATAVKVGDQLPTNLKIVTSVGDVPHFLWLCR